MSAIIKTIQKALVNQCECSNGWITVPCKVINDEFIPLNDGEVFDGTIYEKAIPCPNCDGGKGKIVYNRKLQSKIPKSYYDANMEKFNPDLYVDANGKKHDISNIMKVVESLIQNYYRWKREGKGLYIYSEIKGSGKTFLASCICNTLIEKYCIKPIFVRAIDLIEIDKEEGLNQLMDAEILIIDDIGVSSNSWDEKIFFRIIDYRANNKLMTIYTSNVPIANLPMDDRTADRINANTYTIELPSVLVRTAKANKEKYEFLKEMNLM